MPGESVAGDRWQVAGGHWQAVPLARFKLRARPAVCASTTVCVGCGRRDGGNSVGFGHSALGFWRCQDRQP